MIMLESDRVHQEKLLLNRGRIEGIAESRKEIAGRMLAAKEPDEKIILYSGVTPEELQQIRGDMPEQAEYPANAGKEKDV